SKQKVFWQNIRALIDDLTEFADEQHKPDSAEPGPEPVPAAAPERTSVVCLPARDDADEIAACIVAQTLNRRGIGARAFSANALTAECMEELRQLQLPVVCICTVEPPAWRHSRYLCKRLRTAFPDIKLVAMTWGAQKEIDEIQQRLGLTASDIVVKTIGHAVDQTGLFGSNSEALADTAAERQAETAAR